MSFWSEAAAGASLVNSIQMAPLKRESAQLELKRQKLGMAKAETEAEAWKGIQTEQKRQAAELKSTKGRMFATDAVTYMGATDPEKRDLNVINNDLKDTGVTAAIGKPDGWSVRTVTRSTDGKRTSDEEAVAGKLYEMLGETASEYNEEEMDEVVSSVIKSGYFLMGSDNEVVDLNEFYQTSGAYKYATGEQRSMISATDENMKNELQAVMDKKENRVKIDQKNRETQQEIKLLEDKQYQTNLSLLGKLKTGKTSSTPSPTDIIVSRYQSSEQTDEDFTAMTNDLRLLKFEKAGGGAAGGSLSQSIYDKKQVIADMKESGVDTTVAEEELESMLSSRDKESGGASYAATQQKFRTEVKQARENPRYEGHADDLEFYNKVQLKDKDKSWSEVSKSVETARSFIQVDEKVQKIIKESQLDKNAITRLNKEVAKYGVEALTKIVNVMTGKSDADTLTKKQKAAYDRIDTTLGFEMVKLIKDISGAAVTNEEREYLMDLVMGGTWSDLDSLTEKLDQFRNDRIDDAGRSLNRKVTGGKSLRPKLSGIIEKELNSKRTKGTVGSTLNQDELNNPAGSTTKVEKKPEVVEKKPVVKSKYKWPDPEPDGTIIYKGKRYTSEGALIGDV